MGTPPCTATPSFAPVGIQDINKALKGVTPQPARRNASRATEPRLFAGLGYGARWQALTPTREDFFRSAPSKAARRVEVASHVPGVLANLGFDAAEVLADCGLSVELLDEPDRIMPMVALDRLVSTCLDRTRCPHFGLLVGQRGGIVTIGTLGLLIQNAPDVGTALRELVTLLPRQEQGVALKLDAYNSHASLSCSISLRGVESSEHISDATVAVAFNVMRTLCGPEWHPIEVLLPHRRPANVSPFHRCFRAPVQFDSEEAALIFPAYWLERRLPGANADLHRFIASHLRESGPPADTLTDNVRRLLRSQLLRGICSAARVAKLFGMHRRTLSRRLKQEGTAFNEILEGVRFEIGQQLVAETLLPLSIIADALGYSEGSAFTRAFRRWSGHAPRDWRVLRHRDRTKSQGRLAMG